MYAPALSISSSNFPCAGLVNVSRPPYGTLHSHARAHPPLNFTRVLYIPRHDSMTSHLPLYDVAERYQNSVRGSVFGSYLHSVNLSYMEKPRGDDMSARVEYLVDLNKEIEKCSWLQVQLRTLDHDNNIAATALVSSFGIAECHLRDEPSNGPMTASFPIEPSIRGEYNVPHPYFTFCLPARGGEPEKMVQWQVHPGPNSLFRYTLVNMNTSWGTKEPEILAIYIHIGIMVWLPTDFSEGVLLLPRGGSQEEEAIVVASLLAMLHQLRDDKLMRSSRTSSTSLKLMKRMLSKMRQH